ncbi:DUF1788 domain-containing protein [Patescibacteria group bacterium]
MTYSRKQLDQLEKLLAKENYKMLSDISGDVGVSIFSYDPKDEMLVRSKIAQFERLSTEIHAYDLFEVIIHVLKEEGLLKKVFEKEESEGSQNLYEAIKPIISNDAIQNYLCPKLKESKINLLHGIGKAWPLLRSHSVLSKLHTCLQNSILILFFPGEWNKFELRLFSKLEDDNYYRGVNLNELLNTS